MTENKIDSNKQKSLSQRQPQKIKEGSIFGEVSLFGFNNLNNDTSKKEQPANNFLKKKSCNIKERPQSLKNSLTFSNAQTRSRELYKRIDMFGNQITHGGKHKISFIDRISKNNLIEVIKVENYKEYNKMEEVTQSRGNGCCLVI